MAIFKYRHDSYELDGQWQDETFVFETAETAVHVQELEPGVYLVRQGAAVSVVYAHEERGQLQLSFQGQTYRLERQKKASLHQPEDPVANDLIAPLTGKVLLVQVSEGQELEAGVAALVLESMKMETTLHTPFAARVRRVACAPGDSVSTGQILVELEPLDD